MHQQVSVFWAKKSIPTPTPNPLVKNVNAKNSILSQRVATKKKRKVKTELVFAELNFDIRTQLAVAVHAAPKREREI